MFMDIENKIFASFEIKYCKNYPDDLHAVCSSKNIPPAEKCFPIYQFADPSPLSFLCRPLISFLGELSGKPSKKLYKSVQKLSFNYK